MKIYKLLQKFLMLTLVSYVDGGDEGGGSDGGDDGGSDDGADGGDGGGADGGADDKNSGKDGGSEKGNSQADKFTRRQISNAKKKAAKEVIDNPDYTNNKPSSFTKADLVKDDDFQNLLNEMVEEKLKGAGIDGNSRMDEFESRLEKDDFLNQFKEAGKEYTDYGMSIDPQKGGEILADIEANGFTPQQLIVLQNADFIMGKLKGLPKAPTSTDNGTKPKIDKSKMSMIDRAIMIRKKYE